MHSNKWTGKAKIETPKKNRVRGFHLDKVRGCKGVWFVHDFMFTAKRFERAFWINFVPLSILKDLWSGGMLSNGFLSKFSGNAKDLLEIFDEIYPDDLSILINEKYLIKMMWRQWNNRTSDTIVKEVKCARWWNGTTSKVSRKMIFPYLLRPAHRLKQR